MIHPSPPPAANPSVAPHLFLHLLISFCISHQSRPVEQKSRRSRSPAPLRPSSPSLLGFDLCVIDAVNYPISRLTGGAVTITGIEVFPLHPFPPSLPPSLHLLFPLLPALVSLPFVIPPSAAAAAVRPPFVCRWGSDAPKTKMVQRAGCGLGFSLH